jgi:hypothetical protein
LRLPQSARFAEYAIDHLKRLLGGKMLVDFNEATVIHNQNARLAESAAPKSVNEEVVFLLRILEAKRRALESIVNGKPTTLESDTQGQAEGSPQESQHGLQNGGKRSYKKRAKAKEENTPTATIAENDCSESPANTQHFNVEYPQKSPQSGIFEDFRGVDKRCKSLNLFGGRGRNRIFNQTYFQQHAGQRMTP